MFEIVSNVIRIHHFLRPIIYLLKFKNSEIVNFLNFLILGFFDTISNIDKKF